MKTYMKAAVYLVALTLLAGAGCTGGSSSSGSADLSPVMTAQELPADASAVSAAVLAKVAPWTSGTQGVLFQGGSGSGHRQDWLGRDMRYIGTDVFKLTGTDGAPRTVAGRFNFEGPLGRQGSVLYQAAYTRQNGGFVVDRCETAPCFADSPEPMLLVIPASNVPARTPSDWPGAVRALASAAVPSGTPPPDGEYVMIVLLKERISASAKMGVGISTSSSGRGGTTPQYELADMNGWRMAMVPCRLRNAAQGDVYVRVDFTPGMEAPADSRTRTVGVFKVGG